MPKAERVIGGGADCEPGARQRRALGHPPAQGRGTAAAQLAGERHPQLVAAALRQQVLTSFRSDLGLYVHLHCLVTDGAYEEQGDGALRFLAVVGGADDLVDLREHGAPPPLPQFALDFALPSAAGLAAPLGPWPACAPFSLLDH